MIFSKKCTVKCCIFGPAFGGYLHPKAGWKKNFDRTQNSIYMIQNFVISIHAFHYIKYKQLQ